MVSVAYTPPSPWTQIGQGLGSIGAGYMKQQNLQQEMAQNQQQLDILEGRNAIQQDELDHKKAKDWQDAVDKIMERTDPGPERQLAFLQAGWWRNQYPLQSTLPDGTTYDLINEPRRMTQAQKIAEAEEIRDKETHRAKSRTAYLGEIDDFVKNTKSTSDQYMASILGQPRYEPIKGLYGIEQKDTWVGPNKKDYPAGSKLITYDKQEWVISGEEYEYAEKMRNYSQMMMSLATSLKGPDLEKSQLYYDIVNYIQPGDIDWVPGMGATPLLNKIKKVIKDKKSGKMKMGEPLTPPLGGVLSDSALVGGQQPLPSQPTRPFGGPPQPGLPQPMPTGFGGPPQLPGPQAGPPGVMRQGPVPPGMQMGPPGGQPPTQQQVPPWFGQLSPDDQLAVLEAVSNRQSMQEIEIKLRAGGLIR